MILGQVRRRFLRVVLGLPPDLPRRLEAQPLGNRGLSLADGALLVSPAVEILLDWGENAAGRRSVSGTPVN